MASTSISKGNTMGQLAVGDQVESKPALCVWGDRGQRLSAPAAAAEL